MYKLSIRLNELYMECILQELCRAKPTSPQQKHTKDLEYLYFLLDLKKSYYDVTKSGVCLVRTF